MTVVDWLDALEDVEILATPGGITVKASRNGHYFQVYQPRTKDNMLPSVTEAIAEILHQCIRMEL